MFSQLAKQSTPVQVSSIFKQMKTPVDIPDVLNRFLRIRNVFFFRSSVWCQYQLNDILLKWIEILVCKNGPKLKDTTINECKLRYHWSIVGYTLDNSESVKQYSRIVWASTISSLRVTRYDCLLHQFFSNMSKHWPASVSFFTRQAGTETSYFKLDDEERLRIWWQRYL